MRKENVKEMKFFLIKTCFVQTFCESRAKNTEKEDETEIILASRKSLQSHRLKDPFTLYVHSLYCVKPSYPICKDLTAMVKRNYYLFFSCFLPVSALNSGCRIINEIFLHVLRIWMEQKKKKKAPKNY